MATSSEQNFRKQGCFVESPYKKDHHILGSTVGSCYSWKIPEEHFMYHLPWLNHTLNIQWRFFPGNIHDEGVVDLSGVVLEVD